MSLSDKCIIRACIAFSLFSLVDLSSGNVIGLSSFVSAVTLLSKHPRRVFAVLRIVIRNVQALLYYAGADAGAHIFCLLMQ